MDTDKLDKWLAEQHTELLKALVSVAGRSTDPEVRGIHGRLFVATQTRAEIAELKKKGAEDD